VPAPYKTQPQQKWRGHTPYRLTIADRRGATPHSQPSKGAAATPQRSATENRRGLSKDTLHTAKGPQQGNKSPAKGAATSTEKELQQGEDPLTLRNK